MSEFYARVENAEKGDLPYRNVGVETVKTAVEQPNLFRILFINKRPAECKNLNVGGEEATLSRIYALIANSYNISPDQAKLIHDQMWFYTFGLAMHCVNQPLTEARDKIAFVVAVSRSTRFRGRGQRKRNIKVNGRIYGKHNRNRTFM